MVRVRMMVELMGTMKALQMAYGLELPLAGMMAY